MRWHYDTTVKPHLAAFRINAIGLVWSRTAISAPKATHFIERDYREEQCGKFYCARSVMRCLRVRVYSGPGVVWRPASFCLLFLLVVFMKQQMRPGTRSVKSTLARRLERCLLASSLLHTILQAGEPRRHYGLLELV